MPVKKWIAAKGIRSLKADIIIKNGKCLTMDGSAPCGWIAVSGDRIAALGMETGFEAFQDGHTRVVDAHGATVCPGFIDGHFHLVQTAINRLSVDLGDARSFCDIADLVLEAGRKNPEDSIQGIRLDIHKLKEARMPNRLDLDKIWSNSPVWINSYDYQFSSLNTYGMLFYKIPFTQSGVVCDEKRVPTGIFKGTANALLRGNILKKKSDFYRLEALQKLMPELAAKGLTTICADEGGVIYCDKDAEFINDVIKRKCVYADIELFFQTIDVDRVLEMGLPRLGGSLYVDGTFNARAAAISFDYANAPGEKGTLNFTQEKLSALLEECYRSGLQTALYTIGDRAIELALRAHEYAVNRTGRRNLRHRLEHVELPTADQIRRAAELGLVFSMQPTYEHIWGGPGGMYEDALGENYKLTNPFREILDGGVAICGGSDSDLCPVDYLFSIYSAVNHPVAKHRVNVMEALEMFTSSGAYAIARENEKGYLKVGYLADIAVLDDDLLSVPKDQIRNMKVVCTVKSGRIVYADGKFTG